MLRHTLLFGALSDLSFWMYTKMKVSMCHYERFLCLAGMIFTPQNAGKKNIYHIHLFCESVNLLSPHTPSW